MTEDDAALIQSLIPFVSISDILNEYNDIWLWSDQNLIAEYHRLQRTIPKMPLLPELAGKPPVIRNLRDDRPYIEWERKNGLRFEVVEWIINRRCLYPSRVKRIEVLK